MTQARPLAFGAGPACTARVMDCPRNVRGWDERKPGREERFDLRGATLAAVRKLVLRRKG